MTQTTTMQRNEFPPPGAAASAAPGAAASAAPGGSIPNTPAPEPATGLGSISLAHGQSSSAPGSSHTTTMQTVELGPQGEMITVVTTKTTIITKANGVKRCMESEASSSGVKR